MEASKSFDQSLIRTMLLGQLRLNLESSTTSLLQRTKSIKLAVDIATAAARGGGANWSRAQLITCLGLNDNSNSNSNSKSKSTTHRTKAKTGVKKSKKIVARARNNRLKKDRRRVPGRKRMVVKERIRVLKSLIPGAVSLNHRSLILEALDYVVSLREQVNAMRRITDALVRQ
ncbi:hypothetical protein ZOSMA_202G00500 [Zostera marina]|uniref:IBH1-like N-terminal domain-containing protein n=1 Tax=Zostera marina TaxID=29655 RepID=A0A0K9PLL3_ZOSMR|nr:hypothetical protein ZOSMA_202G00500 [Zostera marina]